MKSKFLWGSAILCCALGLGTVSCSDDDDKEFSIEETYTTNGIETNYDGGIYKIQVKGNSDWVASVPEGSEWVNLVIEKGKGNETLEFLVEPTYDGIGRNATITVKSGSDEIKIPVKQIVSQYNALDGFETAVSKGLGFGFDPISYKYKSQTILNMQAINKVKETDEVWYADLINETNEPVLEAHDANVDSLEDKSDTLKVSLSCNISYGTFKLGISGGLSAYEKRFTQAHILRLAADYPKYEASFDLTAVFDAYNEWVEEGKPRTTDGKPDYRGKMIKASLLNDIDALENAVVSNNVKSYKDNSVVENKCRALVNTYGPCFMTRAIVGGSYNVQFVSDSIWTNETFSLDSAKVTAELKAGLFELKAGVSAEYKRLMTEILNHSNYDVLVKGGNTADQTAIYGAFANPDDWSNKTSLTTWANGLTVDKDSNKSNVTLISCDLTGIWTILGESSKKIMMEYINDIPELKNNDIVSKLLRAEGMR